MQSRGMCSAIRNGPDNKRTMTKLRQRHGDETRVLATTAAARSGRRPETEASPFPWDATDHDDAEEPDGQTARRVAALIEEHKDGPFFIAAGFHKPHVPHTAPQKYFDLYPPAKIPLLKNRPVRLAESRQLRRTTSMRLTRPRPRLARRSLITSPRRRSWTAQVGLLLETLDRLDLWKSTIVVFLGDHGWHFGEHGGYWAKGSLFDESARAPLIVVGAGGESWRRRVRPG